MSNQVLPPEQLLILEQIEKTRADLLAAEEEHSTPKADVFLGPMDIVTPWTATGERIRVAREKEEVLTKELGASIVKERLG